MNDFLVPLLAVGLAELGDKTQLAVLLLSSRTKKHLPLLTGVLTAFFLVDGAAVLAGDMISTFVPDSILKLISGIIFILFGIMTLLKKYDGDGEEVKKSGKPFVSGFSLIFLAEWGDKTQIMTAVFAAEYNPWLVFGGVMLALGILSAFAVYLGNLIGEKLDQKLITRLAGALFILIGVFFIFASNT